MDLDALTQFCLALFGLTALGMALSRNARARRWAPWVGLLLAEPAWFLYSIPAHAWGIVTLGVAYSAVYLWGIWQQRNLPR
jgi:hypothetical protein